jgi:hypothetical protein
MRLNPWLFFRDSRSRLKAFTPAVRGRSDSGEIEQSREEIHARFGRNRSRVYLEVSIDAVAL